MDHLPEAVQLVLGEQPETVPNCQESHFRTPPLSRNSSRDTMGQFTPRPPPQGEGMEEWAGGGKNEVHDS